MSSSSPVTTQMYPSGAVLIPEGGKLNTLFVLLSGELEVSRDGVPITVITQRGTIIGEISVLLDSRHSATIRALTPVEVFVVGDAYNVLEEHSYLLMQIAQLLAHRVATTTAALVALGRSSVPSGEMVLPREVVTRLQQPTE